jgi:hypothetical protein
VPEERKPLSLDEIRAEIKSQPIRQIQIDPNAACGSRCWFCPVRYYSRPSNDVMTPEEFDHVLCEIEDGVVHKVIDSRYTLWLSSYNDIIIDPHLSSRLETLRKHHLRFTVLTNGIGLLKNVDIVNRYKDVIAGYLVNLPAGNAEDYAKFTLNPPHVFDQIKQGLYALYNRDPGLYEKILTITVNGAFDDTRARAQLKYDLPIGDTDKQVRQLKNLFPFFNIHEARPLCDRAGLLKDHAIDNSVPLIRQVWRLPVFKEGEEAFAVGCNGGGESNLGRLGEWLHIGSRSNAYLCCQDYGESSTFGSVKDSRLVDLIHCEERVIQIDKMLRGKCLRCWFAK